MRLILSLALIALASTALADTTKFECKKGTDTLSLQIGSHLGDGPTLNGLQINGSEDDSAYKAFTDILVASKKCEDLTSYVRLETSQVFLCEGEMIAPGGIYGQIILTNGGIEVFKTVLAPASGWSCNSLQAAE